MYTKVNQQLIIKRLAAWTTLDALHQRIFILLAII